MSNPFWLTDTQMARLRPFFPKSLGRPRVDDRRVLSVIFFINRDGLRWCDAPKEYGPSQTLCNLEALERQGGLRSNDAAPCFQGRCSEDRDDRCDLSQGAPHGA